MVFTKQVNTEQFNESKTVPNLNEMLGEIGNEKDKEIFISFLKTGMMDVDLSEDQRSVFDRGYFISDIVNNTDNPDKQIMKKNC